MARLRKSHWRHLPVRPGTPAEERFWCVDHHRECRKVWVREQQPQDGAPVALHLLELEPEQVQHAAARPGAGTTTERHADGPGMQLQLAGARLRVRDRLRAWLRARRRR